ncbi:MAG: hypothetical protein RLZ94_537, partial [Actinomycetota bacterium]
MKILVTGATGFIGTKLCERLRRDGHQVVGLDLWLPSADQHLDAFIRGDIRDPDAVRRALAGCDTVFSLAAAHHDFGIDEATYFDVNEQGSRVICDACD